MAAAAALGCDMRRILAGAALIAASAIAAEATTFYVTVAGLGGEPEYEQRFEGWAKDLDYLLKKMPDGKVYTLYGPAATKAQLESTLRGIASKAQKDDALVLMIIGHGSYDGYDYKVNLPGPDITGVELASALDRIPAGRQLVVNMTSASGASMQALERNDRVVITATKDGFERNATIFARFWVEALRDPTADTDKNESISALEAFKYAERKTANFYSSQEHLATEHAQLEDTGKGEPSRDPSPQNGEGLLAARFTLMRMGAAQAAFTDPAKQALAKRKDELEQQIDELKYRKAMMPPDRYKAQLETLLIDLAKVQGELDK
jgi:hypothetical protein